MAGEAELVEGPPTTTTTSALITVTHEHPGAASRYQPPPEHIYPGGKFRARHRPAVSRKGQRRPHHRSSFSPPPPSAAVRLQFVAQCNKLRPRPLSRPCAFSQPREKESVPVVSEQRRDMRSPSPLTAGSCRLRPRWGAAGLDSGAEGRGSQKNPR